MLDSRVERLAESVGSSLRNPDDGLRTLRRGEPRRIKETMGVVVAALLSAIHMLTLALGAGGVFARGRALAHPLDEAGWERLLAADTMWGVAAVLWIASGLGRVFFGGKEPSFYWRNGLFWVKLALFGVVFALELAPMLTFIRVRRALRQGVAMPRFSI